MIDMIVPVTDTIPMTVQDDSSIALGVEPIYAASPYKLYHGLTEFTPTQSTQVALTKDRIIQEDIVINPIPSNYGLITWDGSVLTVS